MKKISLLSLFFLLAHTASWGSSLHCDITKGQLRDGAHSFSAVLRAGSYTPRYHVIPNDGQAEMSCTHTIALKKVVVAVWLVKNSGKVQCGHRQYSRCRGDFEGTKRLRWGGDAKNGITVRFTSRVKG